FDATLTNLIFSTYFGGNDQDELQKIAVDPSGFIYVCGNTLSTNFPVTPGAFQTTHPVATTNGVNWAAFISKFKPDGSALAYSTYVGGPEGDSAYAIAADAAGCAYVTGSISLPWSGGDFPFGFQSVPGFGTGDGWTAWVAKLRPDGSNFEWFSYLGGSGGDQGFGLVLDKDDNVFVTGITKSLDFPTRDAPQPKFGGGTQDAFVAKISADGQNLLYSTYLGGRGDEWGVAVTLDSNGNLIAVGETASINFPVLNAFQPTNASAQNIAYAQNDPEDAFVTKLSPAVQPPLLDIARSGGNVLLFWSTNATDFALETADASAAPLAWTAVSAQPLTISGQHTVIQPLADTTRLYRLHRP
ncbi:MAG: SBBP repeat-containing protein, partial [Verrucomicrobia bacterium]|nr:SBBP repeat-containing protein [Verrucomicrobiota bacterium]